MRKIKKVRKLLNDLQREMSKGTPAIIEGKNDKKALKKLGILHKTLGKVFF